MRKKFANYVVLPAPKEYNSFMDINRFERPLIGFLVGGLTGLGMNTLILFIFNKLSAWFGREPVQVAWT